MAYKPKKKRNVMRKFTINEISGVDVPAQEGARVLLMKRADPNDPALRKGEVVELVTGVSDGHQHGIDLRRWGDGTLSIWLSYAQAEGTDTNHDHQLIRGDGDVYSISENAGHTHEVDAEALRAAIMDTITKETREGQLDPKELEAMEARTERLEKIVSLTAKSREHFDGLSDDTAKDAFLTKSATDQQADMDAAERARKDAEARKNADDPEVYKTASGIVIRKSDGPTTLALAKQADADRKEIDVVKEENATLKASTSDATYEKRADAELAHLPGTVKQRAAMLRAVDTIEDKDDRDAGIAALKANNERMSWAFLNKGAGGDGNVVNLDAAGSGAEGELEKLTKEHMDKNAGVSYAKAQTAVLDTSAGAEIYERMTVEKQQSAAA